MFSGSLSDSKSIMQIRSIIGSLEVKELGL